MTTKTTLAAIALALMPTFALAQGCNHAVKEVTASSCKEGSVWDEAKGMCVVQPSS
jgi:hypothetical protein